MLQVGENIVFHVRSNKYVEHLNYVIINSGSVLASNTVKLAPYNMRTFHLLVRKEMAPLSTLLVWHVDSVGYVVAQSLPFPVYNKGGNLVSCSFYWISWDINRKQEITGRHIIRHILLMIVNTIHE